jgi:ABC-type lipoprotein release transport system permease subunit
LLLGIVLASTFFAGINIGADTTAWHALSQQLSNVSVDISVIPSPYIIQPGPTFIQPLLFGVSALSAKNVSDAVDAISIVQGITHVEAVSTYYVGVNSVQGLNLTSSASLIGVSEHSLVCNTSSLGENDTYVWAGSPDAGMIHVGDVLTVNVTANYVLQQGSGVNSTTQPTLSFLVKLRVAGFVNLSEQGLSLALGLTQYNELQSSSQTDLLITNWNETFPKLLDAMLSLPSGYIDPFSTTFSVFVDRSSLISAWDVSGSANRLAAITTQIDYKVSPFGLYAQDNLATPLDNFQSSSVALRFVFIIAALPVFFVAWYVGSTVSDVSFDLRRREIGLLLTKGFSGRQLLLMFLLEAALIGLVGGLLGLALSFTLTPLFVGAVGGQSLGALLLEPDVVILTVVFAIIVTFLSVFRSARKASNLAAVDALKEYVYVEEAKPYRQVLPWAALILGSFKIVVFLLGINLQTEMTQLAGASPNVLVFLMSLTVAVIDFGLNYVGPFLFFWGFTKILISGSLKFQEIAAGTVKFLGDFAKLATKNVRRKPARVAAVAFLIAFIIGFSFQAVGTMASQQDLITREAKLTVGSDVSLTLSSPANASQIMNAVENNVLQIQSITTEYGLTGNQSGTFAVAVLAYTQQFWAVTPKTWLSTAYYENAMFSGGSAKKDFEAMSSNNYTIILDRNVANDLDKKVGDNVTETFVGSGAGQTVQLTVVGLFGLNSAQAGQYWSYIPEGLYAQLEGNIRSSASATILIKLQDGADSKAVATKIRGLDIIGVNSVSSLAEQIETQQNGSALGGSLNIMGLGAFFMVGAASVGTALVTLVSLTERKREGSIMSVRGLSFKQLLIMLLTESLSVVTFGAVLGTVGGLIILRGIVASNSAFNVSLSAVSLSSSLNIPLTMRMVFPPGAILTLLVSFVLVFASTITPTVIMAKRYCSRLERVVREV